MKSTAEVSKITTLGYNSEIWHGFYNPSRLLSTGKPELINIAERNNGKSTAWGIVCLREYMKLGKRTIYARRSDDELNSTAPDFFYTPAEIIQDFYHEPCVVKYSDRCFYLNDEAEPFATSVTISKPKEFKSKPFGSLGYRNIIYDECILPEGDEKMYIGSTGHMIREYSRLMTLYQTVDRAKGQRFLNETRMIMIGNNSSFHNPIFLGCGCDGYVDINTKFCNPRETDWALELDNGTGATREELEGAFSYRMATAGDKQNYYENDSFHKDNQVKKLVGVMSPICNFSYGGHVYSYYISERKGIAYISDKPRTDRQTIALTIEDTKKINQVTAYKYNKSPYMKFLAILIEQGNVLFETPQAKTDILTYFNYTI